MTLAEKIREAETKTICWARGLPVAAFPDCGERKPPTEFLIWDFLREYREKKLLINNRYSRIEIRGVIVKDKKLGNKIVWKKI